MKFETIVQLPSVESGVWRRFGVHVFEGKLTVEHMARLEINGDTWLAKNPGKLVELSIIFPSDAGMTSEERTRMAKVIKRWEWNRNAAATVILADGLLGSMHRSVLTGMLMLVPPPHPAKVFGATAAAVAWLTPYVRALCGPESQTTELVLAVEDLCTRFLTRRHAALAARAV